MKKRQRRYKWFPVAICGSILSLFLAGQSSQISTGLFHLLAQNQAMAVLRGEYWGSVFRMGLLCATPLFVLACSVADLVEDRRCRRALEHETPPEFASAKQRETFYMKQLSATAVHRRMPWLAYACLCGVTILCFSFGAVRLQLPQQIQARGKDIALYRTGTPKLYIGALLKVERPIQGGIARIPDARFYYYDTGNTCLRCANALRSQPELTQAAYRVTYLPETGTILSITDAKGYTRTNSETIPIIVPDGYWLYGDLPVPICNQVAGYLDLSPGGRALFDLMYSQVLNKGTVDMPPSVRSFDRPEPLSKEEFQAVLALYEASGSLEDYPGYRYRTDDGKVVRRAYCQRLG